MGIVPLRRLVSQPYHYNDIVKHVWVNSSDHITHINQSDQVTAVEDGSTAMLAAEETAKGEEGGYTPDTSQCACQPRLAEQLHEVDFLKITGRRLRKSRKGLNNPKKDKID